MTARGEYLAACARAEEKKAQARRSLDRAKARVRPGRLVNDAKDAAVGKAKHAGEQVKTSAAAHPYAFGAAAAAFIAYLARRPLTQLIKRTYARASDSIKETYHG
ncbi:MAG: hypothetical protein ABW164_05515 [Sphingobium sp.]